MNQEDAEYEENTEMNVKEHNNYNKEDRYRQRRLHSVKRKTRQ